MLYVTDEKKTYCEAKTQHCYKLFQRCKQYGIFLFGLNQNDMSEYTNVMYWLCKKHLIKIFDILAVAYSYIRVDCVKSSNFYSHQGASHNPRHTSPQILGFDIFNIIFSIERVMMVHTCRQLIDWQRANTYTQTDMQAMFTFSKVGNRVCGNFQLQY